MRFWYLVFKHWAFFVVLEGKMQKSSGKREWWLILLKLKCPSRQDCSHHLVGWSLITNFASCLLYDHLQSPQTLKAFVHCQLWSKFGEDVIFDFLLSMFWWTRFLISNSSIGAFIALLYRAKAILNPNENLKWKMKNLLRLPIPNFFRGCPTQFRFQDSVRKNRVNCTNNVSFGFMFY